MPLTHENSLTGNVPNQFFTVIFFPLGLKYESNQMICAASAEKAEIKRPLLNSFKAATARQNHHTQIFHLPKS